MELLKTQDYLLFIDEKAEIKRGDYLLEKESIINVFPDYLTDLEECAKIIAYRKLNENAKEFDLPLLPNPFQKEIDMMHLLDKDIPSCFSGVKGHETEDYNKGHRESWIKGYKAAQSKQFTLEDMKKAMELGLTLIDGNVHNQERFERFIQSLSTQQLPKEFIPEYKKAHRKNSDGEDIGFPVHDSDELKTITNSEGKQELVGKYIW